MRTAPLPVSTPGRSLFASRRLLAFAGDDRLVEQVRRGNEAAFEVVFERHGQAILSYCRHMLGSRDEAEDAVQQVFASAYNDMLRNKRPITLKPWLFTIARNRCLSMLRRAREEPIEAPEQATTGLSEQVESRAELRQLLEDVGDLPEEQRTALLLAEVGDLSHTDVAKVLGCEAQKVKALVFRARSGLIRRREARETPCVEIREQLANLRGGALRRSELRLHLRDCPPCRAYREQVRQQRAMLAVALPVTPSLGLKSAVLGSVGMGGASAATGGGGLIGGLAAGVGQTGGAAVAKVAVVGALAGGGAIVADRVDDDGSRPARGSQAPQLQRAAPERQTSPAPAARPGERRERGSAGSRARAGERKQAGPGKARAGKRRNAAGQPGGRGRARGREKPSARVKPTRPEGRKQGSSQAPPAARGGGGQTKTRPQPTGPAIESPRAVAPPKPSGELKPQSPAELPPATAVEKPKPPRE